MAIGDAFGRRFENLPRSEIRFDQADSYEGQNRYTDDTQTALAVIRLMISGTPFTPEALADSLIDCSRADPRDGYSPLTRSMLDQASDARVFLSFLSPDALKERRSDGSAMRAPPIGFYPDPADVIRNATICSAVTHGHPDAILATRAIALISWFRYHHGASFREIPSRIMDILADDITPDQSIYLNRVTGSAKTVINPGIILGDHAGYGVPYTEAVILLGAVFALLLRFGTTPQILLEESVRFGGDTDTTAAITLGVALIRPESRILSPALWDDLENGPFGRDYLKEAGDRLSKAYPVLRPA